MLFGPLRIFLHSRRSRATQNTPAERFAWRWSSIAAPPFGSLKAATESGAATTAITFSEQANAFAIPNKTAGRGHRSNGSTAEACRHGCHRSTANSCISIDTSKYCKSTTTECSHFASNQAAIHTRCISHPFTPVTTSCSISDIGNSTWSTTSHSAPSKHCTANAFQFDSSHIGDTGATAHTRPSGVRQFDTTTMHTAATAQICYTTTTKFAHIDGTHRFDQWSKWRQFSDGQFSLRFTAITAKTLIEYCVSFHYVNISSKLWHVEAVPIRTRSDIRCQSK